MRGPRWLAVVGAAAAIAVIALVAPKLGHPGSTPGLAAGAAASNGAAPATAVEVQHHVDYGADVLSRVAVTYGRTDLGSVPVPAAAGASGAVTPVPVPGT